MKALIFNKEHNGWENTRGFEMVDIPEPVLDEKNLADDASAVVVKMKYAGVCGSDKGLWNRTAFKDLVHDSLAREQKNTRILGHEFFGEIIKHSPPHIYLRWLCNVFHYGPFLN